MVEILALSKQLTYKKNKTIIIFWTVDTQTHIPYKYQKATINTPITVYLNKTGLDWKRLRDSVMHSFGSFFGDISRDN